MLNGLALGHLELVRESGHAVRLVLVLRLDQEYFKGNLLQLCQEGRSERLALTELNELLEDLDWAEIIEWLLPLALVEITSGEDDVVSAVLRDELDSLLVILLHELPEVLVQYIFLDGELVLGEIQNFLEHGGGHVHAIKQLKIDVKVRWDVSFLFLELFLQALILLFGIAAHSLSERFFQFRWLAHFHEQRVTLLEQAKFKGGQADLDDGSVVKDLVGDFLLGDVMGQFGSHDQLLCLVELLVNGHVVKLKQDGLNLRFHRAILWDELNEVGDDLVRRSFDNVKFFKLIWLVGKSLLGLLIEVITLIVDVLKFDDANPAYFFIVFEYLEVVHDTVA